MQGGYKESLLLLRFSCNPVQAATSTAALATLTKGFEERGAELTQLRSTLEGLQASHVADAAMAATTISTMSSQLESVRATVKALQGERDEARTTQSELRRSQERVGELEKAIMLAERQGKQVGACRQTAQPVCVASVHPHHVHATVFRRTQFRCAAFPHLFLLRPCAWGCGASLAWAERGSSGSGAGCPAATRGGPGQLPQGCHGGGGPQPIRVRCLLGTRVNEWYHVYRR
jgi:hypothetical protein